MRFDRFAHQYAELAGIQAQCAQELANWVATTDPSGLGLDLGSGTGFMATHLDALRLIQLDLSPAMLSQASGHRVAGDARNMPFATDAFDWGVSNMALQWIADIDDWRRVLKPGAPFWACVVLQGSLPELQIAKRQIGRDAQDLLPDLCFWRDQLGDAELRVECRHIEFANARHALASVRDLGAGGGSVQASYSRAELRELLASMGRSLTYELLWIHGRA